MRAVIQRVTEASVKVDGSIVSEIQQGILVFIGIAESDQEQSIDYMLDKIIGLRIFEDSEEKMNLSLKDIRGDLLIIPNFTLYADARKGRRPNFSGGAKPDKAKMLFQAFVDHAKENYENVKTGVFGADMKILASNDGPVTILLDSDKNF